jgi:hypothetical protein
MRVKMDTGETMSPWSKEVGETLIQYEAVIYDNRLVVHEMEFFTGVSPKFLVRESQHTYQIGYAPSGAWIKDKRTAREMVREWRDQAVGEKAE